VAHKRLAAFRGLVASWLGGDILAEGDITVEVPEPKRAHAVFVGGIDQSAVQKLASAVSVASQQGVDELHMLFQTSGGMVGDGICIYNLFRNAPLKIHLYNAGNVASIGVIAYLGADARHTTQNAAFMIHRTTFSPMAATVDRLQSAANAAALDDRRIESILREHISLPDEKWSIHAVADLWLSANEAIEAKLADSLAEFSPPMGVHLYYVGP
jgi:ATP-dependent Clp protease, protease subunit